MFKPSPQLLADVYKFSHPPQYPAKTQLVYSNTTARSSRMEGVDSVVVFGTQYLIEEYFIRNWNERFFSQPKEKVVAKFKRMMDAVTGKDSVSTKTMESLHDLGYLPVRLKALPEGTLCPIQVPFMTIVNTHEDFYWVTNFLETLTQTVMWQAIVSATIAHQFKKLVSKYADETSDNCPFIIFQCHDFSMRGMSSVETGCVSGGGHLLSFVGTDTVSAIEFLEEFYGANVDEELVGCSVPATEHSVMCAGGDGDESEYETFRRIIEDVYPAGIVSIVSDTWDYWNVLKKILPALKSKIMGRNGKVVIRPDSGDPVKIVTGYIVKKVKQTSEDYLQCVRRTPFHIKLWNSDGTEEFDAVKTSDGKYFDITCQELSEDEVKGSIQILAETFGATKNSKGYLELDPHIGLIYGDSITFDRCEQICERLKKKGFASTNVVFGVGSYTYQYNTRDTFSIACKATHVKIDGKEKPIFKDPKTGGHKKSAKGLLAVVKDKSGKLILKNNCTAEEEAGGELKVMFENGVQFNKTTLSEIRGRLE